MATVENEAKALLRPQVLEARRREWLGTIVIVPPRIGWMFLAIGMCALLVLLQILLWGTYSRSARAQGVLVPTAALVDIRPQGRGIVARILVREGQSVRAGQALIEMRSNEFSSLGETKDEIVSKLELRKQRLLEDRAEVRSDSALQARQLGISIRSFEAQRQEVLRQASTEFERMRIAQALHERWSSAKGIVSGAQLEQQRDVVLQHQTQYQELQRQALELARQAEDAKVTRAKLPSESRQKGNALDRQLAEIEQQLIESEMERAAILRAPVSGRVGNVVVHVGQDVEPDQSLLDVVPVGAELQAYLLVPGNAMGFVSPGNTVLLEYASYPSRRFGQSKGRVVSIGTAPVSAAEASRLTGKSVEESRYLVRVALERQMLSIQGRAQELRPGMEVKAEIVLGKQSIAKWFLEPAQEFLSR